MKECQPLTKAISNAGKSDKIEKMNKNKRHNELEMKCNQTRTANSQDR